jgi:hypothetical protein
MLMDRESMRIIRAATVRLMIAVKSGAVGG